MFFRQYNIVLTADKSVDVKKNVQAANQITLDMKGIRASKTLNTVYNNVSNVDTVMVENVAGGIKIFFQAENAQNASVSFDAIAPVVPVKEKSAKQKVELSSPIDSYAPIYREEAIQGKTSDLFNKLTKKTSSITSELEENSIETSETINKVVTYGLLGLLAFSVIRLFKRKEPDMKIGLSQSLNDREVNMYRGVNPLESQHLYQDNKNFTTVNYGLNAYKRENTNPYEQGGMKFHNPRLQEYVSPMTKAGVMNALQQQQYSQTSQTAAATQTKIKKHTTPVNTAPVNQSNPNIDNLKFLESMTAIYEKSGRHDLAQGLKASLSKNNIKA